VGIIIAAISARRGGRAYTLWPDARQPMICADAGYPPAAEWLRRTMAPRLRRLPDAATWTALRAGALVVAQRAGLAEQVARPLMGTRAPLRVAMFSPSGQAVSKVICFVFREGDEQPQLVVKAMAEARFSPRLRVETAVLEEIRERVGHDPAVAGALPPPPAFAAEWAGEFVVAEPLDPLGSATGTATRESAQEWLRAFQAASRLRERPWDPADDRWVLDTARESWRLAGRRSEAVVAKLVALLAPLQGTAVPRCAVHGDFWRGNIAAANGAMRVYDWEWAELEGLPFTDLWTYELAELRIRARHDRRDLDGALSRAVERIRAEVARRGLDERLARATLVPVLGSLSFRVRRRLAMPDELEETSIAIMAAAERLLARG
jgi:hypothetical protein